MQVQLDRSMAALGMSHTLAPAHLNSPVSIKPAWLDKDNPDGPPTLPPALDELDPDDYPDTLYWTQSSWIEYKKKQANQGYSIFGLTFLCNTEGDCVSRDRLDAMMKCTKQLWNTLYWHHQDPTTWGKKGNFIADFFSRHMHNSFMEFGLCEGNWKADAFAIVHYPDWASKVHTTGAILCMFSSSCIPSPHICCVSGKKPLKGKWKHEDDLQGKLAPTTKRQKVRAVPPPVDATIIHIEDDMYTSPIPPSLGPTPSPSTSESVPASLTPTNSLTSAGSSSLVGSVPIIVHTALSEDSDQSMISTHSAVSTSGLPPMISEALCPASAAGVQDPNAHLNTCETATNPTKQPELETFQVSHQADKVSCWSHRQACFTPCGSYFSCYIIHCVYATDWPSVLLFLVLIWLAWVLTLFCSSWNLVVLLPPEQIPSIKQLLALPALPKATTKQPTKADEKEFFGWEGFECTVRQLFLPSLFASDSSLIVTCTGLSTRNHIPMLWLGNTTSFGMALMRPSKKYSNAVSPLIIQKPMNSSRNLNSYARPRKWRGRWTPLVRRQMQLARRLPPLQEEKLVWAIHERLVRFCCAWT